MNLNPVIVIPTLNEREFLGPLVQKIKDLHPSIGIIIVDDNSSDGTGVFADELAEKYDEIHVIHRPERKGVGAAIVDGFRMALEKKYDPIITMDGDQSHDPVYLKDIFSQIKEYDLVICSRYIRGVRVDGWKFRKLLISKLANMYVAYLLVKPIWDFTSGFRAYTAHFLSRIDMDSIPPYGYLFQIHMIHLAFSLKLRVTEIPFLYKDYEYKPSKFSSTERRITFFKSFRYRAPLLEIVRHLTYVSKDYHRFVEEYDQLLNPPPIKKIKQIAGDEKFSVDIGIMAYNEENNIARCLQALLEQKLESCRINAIYVVSSGSTDLTNTIIREYHHRYKYIHLIEQSERLGKASAINDFLKISEADICVLESADTITEPDTIEKLIRPFRRKEIGMTGAHPIPVNSDKTFTGFTVVKMWKLHHLLALKNPKCGELIAFRNILSTIPAYTAVDEAVIESRIRETGYGISYVPEAIVHNKGPETLKDLIRQRVRISTGHKHLLSTKGYGVATLKPAKILSYVLRDMKWTPREVFYTLGMILVEGNARIIGNLNFYFRDKNPYIWDVSFTTKNVEMQTGKE